MYPWNETCHIESIVTLQCCYAGNTFVDHAACITEPNGISRFILFNSVSGATALSVQVSATTGRQLVRSCFDACTLHRTGYIHYLNENLLTLRDQIMQFHQWWAMRII